MEVVQSLGGNRRSMMDPDEIEGEQQERDRDNQINKEFKVFVKEDGRTLGSCSVVGTRLGI